MIDAIKGLFGSKKFWMTVGGSAITAGLSFAGIPVPIIAIIAGLFGTGTMAQGIADHGKEEAKIKEHYPTS